MLKFKEIAFKTKLEDEIIPTLTSSQRSIAITSGIVCSTMPTIDCKVDMTGNVDIFTFELYNTVYNNSGGVFDGGDLLYILVNLIAPIGGLTQLCKINNLGKITEITTHDCSGPE